MDNPKVKNRVLSLLVNIMEQPYRFTKAALSKKYNVSVRTISRDFEDLELVGFTIRKDEKYRYALEETKHLSQLKNLLHFSEEDQLTLVKALNEFDKNGKQAERIKQKVRNIYNYQKLGYANLKKPYLKKLNQIEQAKKENRNIILKAYRSSNSNAVSDRVVEAFHYSPDTDIVQAYDLQKNALRHYRISRIQRIELSSEAWANADKHHISATDPFQIVSDEQVMVNIRLKVGGYNELVQRFPLTQGSITEDYEEGIYDFTAKVNKYFFGLSNFILGNFHQIEEIVEPEELRVHLLRMVKDIEKKL